MAEKVSPEIATAEVGGETPPESSGGLPPEKGLEILGVEPETFQTSQGPLTIGPMVMIQISKFLIHAEALLPLIQGQATKGGGEFDITALMAHNAPAFFAAVAVAAKTEPAVIEQLLPDEFIRVVTKVFVVNLDFFVRTLPAALGVAEASVLTAISKLTQRGGASVSRGLFNMAIGSKISAATPTGSTDSSLKQ